jgi:hypothetical protein
MLYIRHDIIYYCGAISGNRRDRREVFHIVNTDKTAETGNRTFLINVVGRQHATWQGTVTLLGEKATQVTKLPRVFIGNEALETLVDSAETRSFRSLLELIHLINGALEESDE